MLRRIASAGGALIAGSHQWPADYLLPVKFDSGSNRGRGCCPLIPLAVSIDHASRKNVVKLVQKGIEAEIAALGGVAFRQRSDGEKFVNFASALDLPVNSANASLLDISTNTEVSSIKSDAEVEKHHALVTKELSLRDL